MREREKHILSNFASKYLFLDRNKEFSNDKNSCNGYDHFIYNEPTTLTETVETSDQDEFLISKEKDTIFLKSNVISGTEKMQISEPTYITHSIESSDPDEFTVTHSLNNEVKNVESIFLLGNEGPTKMTYTAEATDEDEFILV